MISELFRGLFKRNKVDDDSDDDLRFSKRNESFKVEAQGKGRSSSDGLVKQYYKRYELDWDKLRAYLEQLFPKTKFPMEIDATNDYYVFYAPRILEKVERDHIRTLRKDYRP
ncbi:hypothetical protein GQ53DRAFT_745075 [Thozetella sp. PMI_491]|nr:hypothetical protein GQ53DRAFT_745075 [Thozetella sp. PMI_491]